MALVILEQSELKNLLEEAVSKVNQKTEIGVVDFFKRQNKDGFIRTFEIVVMVKWLRKQNFNAVSFIEKRVDELVIQDKLIPMNTQGNIFKLSQVIPLVEGGYFDKK